MMSSAQVCRATGATKRQLRYWLDTGLVRATVRSSGAGSWNKWSNADVDAVHEIMALRSNGVTLQRIRVYMVTRRVAQSINLGRAQ